MISLPAPLSYSTCALCAISIIAALIIIYGLHQFNGLRHLPEVQIRFPNVIKTQTRVLIFILLILSPITAILMDLSKLQDSAFMDETGYYHYFIVMPIRLGVVSALSFFMTHIEAMRVWLMYYRLKLLVSLQNEEWGSSITSNFWRLDFYLKHRATRGNPKWLGKRGTLYWIIASSISGFGSWYITEFEVHPIVSISVYTLKAILFLSPSTFIAFLYRRVPKQRTNNMMIDEEFKMMCYVVALSFIAYMASFTVIALEGETEESFHWNALFPSWMFSLCAPSIVATIWIPRKLKVHETLRMMERLNQCPLTLKEGLFKECGLNADGTSTISYADQIRILFLDKEKMKAMARWMIRDMTLESFLAFVEMAQFKESVIAVIKERNPHFVEGDDRQRYKFYDHCPKSSIVFSGGLDKELKNVVDDVDDSEGQIVLEMEEVPGQNANANANVHGNGNGNGNGNEEHGQQSANVTPHHVPVAINNVTPNGIGMVPIEQVMDRHPVNVNKQEQNEPVVQCERRRIVLMASDVHRLKRSAHLLFEKYIDTNSALQINIGYEIRDTFDRLEEEDYASMRPLGWIALYDTILLELVQYILQSYFRMISHLHRLERERDERIS